MLTELRVENFAIIDHLELRFDSGLVTLTGETGAGKSIIIDAVETLLGVRAETTLIRSGADRALIEGTFQFTNDVHESIHKILVREDLLDDPEFVTLSREIRREGRNIARVNGRSITVALLREIGDYLVDVHGQSEHLSLLHVRNHLGLLDRYASVDEQLNAYSETFAQLQEVQDELRTLRQAESEAAQRADLLTYQINEIESAKLQPGEDEELKLERDRLANAENIASSAQDAIYSLDEGTPETPAVTDRMGAVVSALTELVKLDPSNSALEEQVQNLFDGLADLARDLRAYLDLVEYNPKRLEYVEERLELITDLKRKYGKAIEEIIVYAQDAVKELEDITHAEERIVNLEVQRETLLNELAERGQALSQKRHAAAEALSESIEKELDDLRMARARFGVDFKHRPDPDGAQLVGGERVAYDASGFEQVEFLVEPNPGEGLKPLARIASGGETSRLMLALKNVLTRADPTPTLIFDEIDQGIGGRVGAIVGEKLWNLAQNHQVFCVTHLPQLAAFGGQHLRVYKELLKGRTVTQADFLQEDARLNELADMLGDVSDGTLQSAREIVTTAQKVMQKGTNE